MMMRATVDERGGIVLGWLIKLAVSIAIVGAVAFEAGAVVVAHVGADTAANDASGEAAAVVSRDGNDRAAESAAAAAAAAAGARLIDFSVSSDRKSLTVVVEKRARTLVLHRVSATRSWGVVRTTRRRAVVA